MADHTYAGATQKEESKARWRKGGQHCAAIGCSNSRRKNEGMSFHRFPSASDKERCRTWVQNSRREDIQGKDPGSLYKSYVLCREHFEESQFSGPKTLKKDAVPTIFKVPNPPKRLELKRKRTNRDKTSDSNPKKKFKRAPKKEWTHEELHRENKKLKMRLYRLRMAKAKAARVVHRATAKRAQEKAKQKKLDEAEVLITDLLDKNQAAFIMTQLRAAQKNPRGMRWTNKEKAMALTLLHASPKTYRILRRLFVRPCEKTLRNAVQKLKIYQGFNASILAALEVKLQKEEDKYKLVVLSFDEMAIKQGVSYDPGQDRIEGVSKDGRGAKYASVFMIRSLLQTWKQPIGYFLEPRTMEGDRMAALTIEAIELLKQRGIRVLVLVCDQGADNMKMFNLLGISIDRPYFFVGDDKIFALYDPPHLLKNIRNNWKAHGYDIAGKEVLWSHLVDFYQKDTARVLRAAPRLKSDHINVPPFSHLRVYLAAQVLSHSVAVGMGIMAEWNIITKDALVTADFVEKIDCLFNVFNSRSKDARAPMRHAISDGSGHVEFLQQLYPWFQQIKSKSSRRPYCLDGWLQAMNMLTLLWKYLSELGVHFLLTSRLNQDCLENIFSQIRAKGGQRDNPNAQQFRAAFRQVLIDAVMLPSRGTNCEEDMGEFLLSMDSIQKDTGAEGQGEIPGVLDTEEQPRIIRDISLLPASVRNILDVCTMPPVIASLTYESDLLKTNVQHYVAGYVAHKLVDKACGTCSTKLVAPMDHQNPNHKLLIKKSYTEASQGLVCPSQDLATLAIQFENKYQACIQKIMVSDGVKSKLMDTIGKQVNTEWLHCEKCKIEKSVLHLLINIRLNHTICLINRELKETKAKKNKKALQFDHC